MLFKRNVFTVACCVLLHFRFLKSETTTNGKSKEEVEGEEDPPEKDDRTFVALIDIVFTDGSKRTCTGTIIHDNVVITAAHCFCHRESEHIKPELTASFVVIGTKKMFDTNYEQYLPIERILTHPKFRGWSADLSLIYTFAAMTADKPGRVLPLAGEKMSNPVDSNVTVYSWGHCKDQEEVVPQPVDNWHIGKTTPKKPCDDSAEEVTELYKATVGLNSKRSRGLQKDIVSPSETELPKRQLYRMQSRFQTESRKNIDLQLKLHNIPLQHNARDRRDKQSEEIQNVATTKPLSRYLTSSEDKADGADDFLERHRLRRRSLESSENNDYKNWRRNMGKLQNKLTVETFGFINMAACKKIVEGSSSSYKIINGEVTCYTSDEHYINDEDSGAPAVRRGQLVAVTVGGAQCDGDHVGIGMKMNCYCTWIADNLPGGANISCCKNCCDSRNNEDSSRNMFRNRHKYLLN